MEKTGERGPIYGTELIESLPLGTGGFCQAMPSMADLKLTRKYCERVSAGYEVLLRHFQEVVEERDTLKQRLACVVRNCQHIDDTKPRDEPGPMCGPTWGKQEIREAAECVVAIAFGNTDGLSVKSHLEAVRMAAEQLKVALGMKTKCYLCDGLGGYAIVGSTGPGQTCTRCSGTGFQN